MKIKPQKFDRLETVASEPSYPSFSIDLKAFPDAKDWKVGETYKIEMTVRQSSMNQYKKGNGSVGFEILEMEGEESETETGEIEKPNYSRIKK